MEPNNGSGESECVLFNAWEDIVDEVVREQMQLSDICQCDKCFKDVCALVLNQIPSRYVTSQAGALFTKLPAGSVENKADILVHVTQAIATVGKGPKH